MSELPTLPQLPDELQPLRVVTHDGSFHADEVFALAALRLAHGVIGILRSRDPQVLAECDLRVDVGRKYDPQTGDFDHHQGDAGERPNGIKYASFGLVWKQHGAEICGNQEIADEVDTGLVAPIDADDNGQSLVGELNFKGIGPYGIGRLIGTLGPQWDDEDREAAEQAGFGEALRLADGILQREIAGAQARARAKEGVRQAIAQAADPRLIELPSGMPWKDVVLNEAPEALVVIYQRTGSWGVQAVPSARSGFDNRRDLPQAWAGLEGKELAAVTGVDDAVFCHVGRFMAVAGSREGALKLAELSLKDD